MILRPKTYTGIEFRTLPVDSFLDATITVEEMEWLRHIVMVKKGISDWLLEISVIKYEEAHDKYIMAKRQEKRDMFYHYRLKKTHMMFLAFQIFRYYIILKADFLELNYRIDGGPLLDVSLRLLDQLGYWRNSALCFSLHLAYPNDPTSLTWQDNPPRILQRQSERRYILRSPVSGAFSIMTHDDDDDDDDDDDWNDDEGEDDEEGDLMQLAIAGMIANRAVTYTVTGEEEFSSCFRMQ